jgi:hypothetical protein
VLFRSTGHGGDVAALGDDRFRPASQTETQESGKRDEESRRDEAKGRAEKPGSKNHQDHLWGRRPFECTVWAHRAAWEAEREAARGHPHALVWTNRANGKWVSRSAPAGAADRRSAAQDSSKMSQIRSSSLVEGLSSSSVPPDDAVDWEEDADEEDESDAFRP